jgi:hypothetical protein
LQTAGTETDIEPLHMMRYQPREISDQEISALCSRPPETRYTYFIKRCADEECLVLLLDEKSDSYASFLDNEGKKRLPVWSNERFAYLMAREQWKGYIAEEVSLNAFLEVVLPMMKEGKLEPSVFPVPGDFGMPVTAQKLEKDFLEELKNYE